MNKEYILGAIQGLSPFTPKLPDELNRKLNELQRVLEHTPDAQFHQATDGAVTKPAGQAPENDVRYLVYEVYSALNDVIAERRGREDVDQQFISVVSRLQGQVDAYDRDFP